MLFNIQTTTDYLGFGGCSTNFIGRSDMSELRVVLCNFWQNLGNDPANIEIPNPESLTYTAVGLVYNGICVPVTFSSSQSFVLPAGTSGPAFYTSDPIYPWQFGVSRFPRGAAVQTRWTGTVQSLASPMLASSIHSGPTDQMFTYDPTAPGNVPNVYGTGRMNLDAAASNKFAVTHEPTMLIGRPDTPSVAILNIGDSIITGPNDFFVNGWGNGFGGGTWSRRTASQAGFAFCNMSQGGGRYQCWALNSTRRRQAYQWFTHMIAEPTTNDIVHDPGVSASIIEGYATGIWSDFRSLAIGGGVVYQALVLPRCADPTTRGTTIAGQTPLLGFEDGGLRDQLNVIYQGHVSGALNGVLDFRLFVEYISDHTVWGLRPFTSVLMNPVVAVDEQMYLNDRPQIGECMVFAPGTADVDSMHDFPIYRVDGIGPYFVTNSQGFEFDHPAGTVVRAARSSDLTHPSAIVNAQIADYLVSTVYNNFTAST